MQQKSLLFIITSILCLSISYAGNKTYYRLPKVIRAVAYYLNITVNMDRNTFEGYLLFDFHVLIPTKSIELHKSSRLKIKDPISMTLRGKSGELAIESCQENNDVLVITFAKELDAQVWYWLKITKFQGVLNKYQTGFYWYEYVDGAGKQYKYAAALLKPTHARTVFPCLDEPDQKAKFKISITRPNNYNAVSNSKKISSTPVDFNMTRDDFEETQPMSTYLVSFIISQLSLSKKVVNGHRALAQERAINRREADYSIEAADTILRKFEQYVGIKYPLKNLYHAAIPMDLSTNMALTSWGLIVYKESFFLYPRHNCIEDENINALIAHQIAHIYFENFITPDWWTHSWIHEGLSDYLSYKLVAEIHPDWLAMTNFKLKVLDTLHRDSFPYSEALTSKKYTPVEIHDNMHIILRPKGSAIMYMLESILTPKVFQDGLKRFIKDNIYKTVEPIDLYHAIGSIETIKMMPQEVELVMWTWDTQSGYPLVQVTRNYRWNSHIVKLEQKPFELKHRISRSIKPIWFIPINYATKHNLNFYDLQPTVWLNNASIEIHVNDLKDLNSWLLVNKQGAYFYRVNYDKQNWILIVKTLLRNHTSIDVFHRMHLIDDCNALAEADIIQYDILVTMLRYLPKETEYGPLNVFKRISLMLKNRLFGTEAEKYINKYFGNPVEAIYNRLQKEANVDTNHIIKMKLKLLFSWLCELNHPKCISESKLHYEKFKNGRTIQPEIEEQVFCYAVQMKDKSIWNYMFTQTRLSKNDEFQKSKFLALACINDIKSLEIYLEYAKTLNRDLLALALMAVSVQGPTARDALTNYAIKRMPILLRSVGGKLMEVVLGNIGLTIQNKSKLMEFKKIASQQPSYKYLFESAFELAENNIKWREKHLEEFMKFSKAPLVSISSGSTYYLTLLNVITLVLYTLFITILN